MGSDEIFKRNRKELEERKAAKKTPKPGSMLIVTEGTETEPLYFCGMANYIKAKYNGGQINVIDVQGIGKGTRRVVEEAIKLASRSPFMYENVWVAFDKDEFKDFDDAIKFAQEQGIKVAWSNQSFEYWLYLHFEYCISALHRDEWFQKVDEIFQERQIGNGCYKKNLGNMFALFSSDGKLKTAIANAKRCEARYKNKLQSQCDPCTTVHHLVSSLKDYLTELLK